MTKGRNRSGNQENIRHNNRIKIQDERNAGRGKRTRADAGTELIMSERAAASENYKLDWFQPTEAQKEIIHSMCVNDLTAIQGSSGVGKSTTVIWQALNDMKRGCYKRIVFIKTPSQVGDDDVGALKGTADEKLFAHWVSMKSIFHTFMSKAKLEMEEKNGRIVFTVPNFIAGQTLDDSLVIIDEAQMLSPKTVKLLLERCGKNSRAVIMGDRFQDYSAKRRKDGFTDFVIKITELAEDGFRYTKEPTMGYVQLFAEANMRSDLSRRIVELYEVGE